MIKKKLKNSGFKGWLYLLPAILFLGGFMFSFIPLKKDTILLRKSISVSVFIIILMCCMIPIFYRQ